MYRLVFLRGLRRRWEREEPEEPQPRRWERAGMCRLRRPAAPWVSQPEGLVPL